MNNNKSSINYKPMKINFNALSGDEFENMCYWLIDDMPEFKNVHQVGVENTKAIDISAKKNKDLYYFQVKRYKSLNNKDIEKIMSLLKEKIKEDGIKPDAFVIMTSNEVGANKRQYMKDIAKKLGLNISKLDIWDGNKVEKLLYKHKKVLQHFYKDGTDVKIKGSSLATLLTVVGIAAFLFIASVLIGLLFEVPGLSQFSHSIFGEIGQRSGYIEDFAKDLDDLLIIRNVEPNIKELRIEKEARSLIMSAQLNLVNDNEDKCIEILNELVKKDKKFKNLAVFNFILGTAKFIDNDKKSEIERIYIKAFEDSSKVFWQIYNNYGVLVYHMGDINKALNLFFKAQELYDSSPELYRNLSIAYNRLGETDKALATLLKAQDLINNMDNNSGTIAMKNDDTEEGSFKKLNHSEFSNNIEIDKEDYIKRVDNKDAFKKELDKFNINEKNSDEIINRIETDKSINRD
ncbi:MAG: restriction endonuclease [Spirochaetota bacterium]